MAREVREDPRDHVERQVMRESRVCRELLALMPGMVTQALKDSLDHRESQDHKDQMERLEMLELWAQLELQECRFAV